MVARTKPSGELVVVFMRDAVELERHHAVDGSYAARMAALMVTRHDPLRDGDILTVMEAR
jgi:hypothetical protein